MVKSTKTSVNQSGDFLRTVTSVWGVAFFLMMGSFMMDVVVFARMGAFFNSFGYMCVLAIYYAGWLIVLHMGRGVTAVMLIVYFLMFLVFKEYYKFHIFALEPQAIWNTATAGLRAGWMNKASLFDGAFWVVLGYLIFELVLNFRKSFLNIKRALIGVAMAVLSVLLAAWVGLLLVEGIFEILYPNLYFAYKHNMIYQLTWPKNLILSEQYQIQKNWENDIKKGNTAFLKEIQSDTINLNPMPKHLFLIQVESLTNRALHPYNGRQAMPFLSAQTQTGFFVMDKNHPHCLGSANTDFMMMTGVPMDCARSAFIVFDNYPPVIYKNNKTIAQRLAERGYQTTFLHGFDGAFFNRRRHYRPLGFERLVFNEDFPAETMRTDWGVDDNTLLTRAAEVAFDADKTFIFVITAGMHPPYFLPSGALVFWPNASTMVENYLNASYLLDMGLKNMYDKAPDDSLFIVYGDHNVPDIGGLDTPFVVYYKGENPPILPPKEEGFEHTIRYIHSLVD